MKPKHEVADIIRKNVDEIESYTSNQWQIRTLKAIAACRTIQLGGHIDRCTNNDCQTIHISYNSCRNRHCPKCQGHKREEWIQKRENELLNTTYFHVVFTLPHELNFIALYDPAILYKQLFDNAWSVVKSFAANPKFLGAKTGMIAILHTWGQNLSLHPHLHCIIPGGGITQTNKWKHAIKKDKYLFNVKAMANVFRARMLATVRQTNNLPQKLSKTLISKKWVVYCKQPFWGPEQVIEYLGRYTHKIAISNHRIKHVDNETVFFTAKDYKKGGASHTIPLSKHEFLRRFALHILPKGFVRIRHYGILSSATKKKVKTLVDQQIGSARVKKQEPIKHRICFVCKTGQLVTIQMFDARGPPKFKSNVWFVY
jgi:hypothetical protein